MSNAHATITYTRAKTLISELKAGDRLTHADMLAHRSMIELLKLDKDLSACLRTLEAMIDGGYLSADILSAAARVVSVYGEAIRWDIDRLLENTLPDPTTTDCDECCYPIPDSCTSNMNGFHSSSCSLTDDDSEN